MSKVLMIMGYPASGKGTVAAPLVENGYVHLNRDAEGGKVVDLVPKMTNLLAAGKNVILDNTFPTAESRKPFIEAAKKIKAEIVCAWLQSTIEDAQFNACVRMIKRKGRLLDPSEHKKEKDPNLFPVAVLFAYRKAFQKPDMSEGFTRIEPIKFKRVPLAGHTNKAVILDYDGTLRITKSGGKYPLSPSDIEVFRDRAGVLKEYQRKGYLLLGASNQSGISHGELTETQARQCFEYTNRELGMNIDYSFCPHQPAPISCYCRKPMCGLGVTFIMKYKLNTSDCVMVGDLTSDHTFASRCGFQYADHREFFKG